MIESGSSIPEKESSIPIGRGSRKVSTLEGRLTQQEFIRRSMAQLTGEEVKAWFAVWDATHGFGKEADQIGLLQLCIRSGLSKTVLTAALHKITVEHEDRLPDGRIQITRTLLVDGFGERRSRHRRADAGESTGKRFARSVVQLLVPQAVREMAQKIRQDAKNKRGVVNGRNHGVVIGRNHTTLNRTTELATTVASSAHATREAQPSLIPSEFELHPEAETPPPTPAPAKRRASADWEYVPPAPQANETRSQTVSAPTMPTEDESSAWVAIKARIRPKIAEVEFSNWLAGTFQIGQEDGVPVVLCPDTAVVEYIRIEYANDIGAVRLIAAA